jgi:lipid A 1-phosphatase
MKTIKFPIWREAWRQSKQSMSEHSRLIWLASIVLLLCMLYPSNLDEYRKNPPIESVGAWLSEVSHTPQESMSPLLKESIQWVEDQGRFIPTAAQVLVPLLALDKIGGAQLLILSVATTTATHVFKRVFNDVQVAGTVVGQRPKGGQHNVPSGHSSMAASALGFLWRRYGVFHIYYVLPLVLATMLTRVLLSAHTISAVLAGALLGFLLAYVMTSPRQPVNSA